MQSWARTQPWSPNITPLTKLEEVVLLKRVSCKGGSTYGGSPSSLSRHFHSLIPTTRLPTLGRGVFAASWFPRPGAFALVPTHSPFFGRNQNSRCIPFPRNGTDGCSWYLGYEGAWVLPLQQCKQSVGLPQSPGLSGSLRRPSYLRSPNMCRWSYSGGLGGLGLAGAGYVLLACMSGLGSPCL